MAASENSTPAADAPTPAAAPWRNPVAMCAAALLLGLIVQFLFYGRPVGISFLVWAVLGAVALLALAAVERVRPAPEGLVLGIPLLFFAAMVAAHAEPMTVFLDAVLTLALFALWVRLFWSGRLFRWGWIDYGLALVWVPLESWIRPWAALNAAWRRVAGERGQRSRLLAVLRGLLLALPVVVVFAGLLSAADLVFSDYVTAVLHWLGLDRLAELILRLALAMVSGLFFLGAMAVAVRRGTERKLIGEERPLVEPFFGSTESAVVLAAVDLLFGAFVAVQFTYLFGGQANITTSGYTYAEYARRGFGELVAVSVLTLGMILALSAFTRREGRASRSWFNGLCAALVALVGVILASALMRLLLYEGAYGFSRLRTYTHVAILWMGVLFLAILGLLLANRIRQFASAWLAVVIGFTATLNLMGVDAFIVERNAARLAATGDLDAAYLATLSEDAVPQLVRLAQAAPQEMQEDLWADLACRRAMLLRVSAGTDWRSFHWGRGRAIEALDGAADRLNVSSVVWMPYDEAYPEWGRWQVVVHGEPRDCYPSWVD